MKRDTRMTQAQSAVPREGLHAFLLYSNVPVGGIAVAFTLGTYGWLGLMPDVPLLVLALCGTFLVYQADRALHLPPEDALNQPQRWAWVEQHRSLTWGLTVVALGGAVVVLPMVRTEVLVLGSVLAGVGALYVAPLLPGRRRLKGIWYLKPVAIAGAWAVGGVVLPVVEAGQAVTVGVGALLGARVLFVLPNALLADWPDRAGDRRAGLGTPALRLSEHALRRLALALLLGSGGLLAAAGVLLERPALGLVDAVGLLLMLGAVVRPRRPSRWFYGFVIDVIIAWPIVTFGVAWIA